MNENCLALISEIRWLEKIIEMRLKEALGPLRINYPKQILYDQPLARPEYSNSFTNYSSIRAFPVPDAESYKGTFGEFIKNENLTFQDRILLCLCLSNHVVPGLLHHLFQKDGNRSARNPDFGGVLGENFPFFIPTGLTYIYIMGGYDVGDRMLAHQIFNQSHLFEKKSIIFLEPHYIGEPTLSGKLVISESWIEYFTIGQANPKKDSIKYHSGNQDRMV